MIGSAAGLSFNAFLVHLAPICIVIQLATILVLLFVYRNDLQATAEDKKQLLSLNCREAISDWKLLQQSLSVLLLTIAGFMLHETLHLETATIALAGATLLMLIARQEPEEVLLGVEWPTIFFFAGLFMLVGGLKASGVVSALAGWCLSLTHGDLLATSFVVLWLSAIASAFIDNIPFVATMIPLLQEMGQLSGLQLEPAWWSLALGACLGGNGTLIGASANVVVAGIAEKNGISLTFNHFIKIAFPLMLLSILLSHLYIWFRYF